MQRGFGVGVALAATLATLSVAGCGAGAADPSGASRRDHDVVLSAPGAVLTLATAGGRTQRFAGGVASADRTTVVTAASTDASTDVIARDVASGRVRWSRTVSGSYGVRVVSHDGSRAALGPGAYSSSDYPVVPRVT